MLFGHIHELLLCIDTKHASALSFSPDKQASPAADRKNERPLSPVSGR
jgi:hypothetical protein